MPHRGLPLALAGLVSALLGCSSPQAEDGAATVAGGSTTSSAPPPAAPQAEPGALPPPSAHLTDFVPWEALPVRYDEGPGFEGLRAFLERLDPITVSDPGGALPGAEAGEDPVSPPPSRDVPPAADPTGVQPIGGGLVVLRGDELVHIDTSGGGLHLQGRIPAHAPHVSGQRMRVAGRNWRWELLQHGERLMVASHDPDRRALEVGVFDVLPGGELRYRDTVALPVDERELGTTFQAWRSGDTLVLYSAVRMFGSVFELATPRPEAQRRERVFTEPPPPRRVYRADRLSNRASADESFPGDDLWLHTVTRCPVAQLPGGCRSEAVLGPATDHALHAGQSVYLTGRRQNDEVTLLRFPAEGIPQALRIFGWIRGQVVREHDGHLEALVNTAVEPRGHTPTIWQPVPSTPPPPPRMQLLRVPLEAFGGVGNRAPWDAYQRLSLPEGYDWADPTVHFSGDWLLYSDRQYGSDVLDPESPTYAVHTGEGTRQVLHDRSTTPTAPLGDAVILMNDADSRSEDPVVRFTRMDFGGQEPQVGAAYRLPGFRMGRSRGSVSTRVDGPDTGVTGLSVVGADERRRAGVLFLRHRGLELEPVGQLNFSFGLGGEVRTLFVGDRIFVMLDDEVVEGRLRSGPQGEAVEEVARLNFAPRSPDRAGSGLPGQEDERESTQGLVPPQPPRILLQPTWFSEQVRGDTDARLRPVPGDQPVGEGNRGVPE